MADVLNVAGAVAATALAGGALLTPRRDVRSLLIACSLILAVALVVGLSWDGELRTLREDELKFTALTVLAVALIASLAELIRRYPLVLPLAALAALPIRVPLETAGDDANLLLPLYLVIAAGVAAALTRGTEPQPRPLPAPAPLRAAFAAAILLYALQASYSSDIAFATKNVAFFLVPFAALFVLLAEVSWDRRTLRWTGVLVVGGGVVFALIGIGQSLAEDIFWNPALTASNDFHFYFRVNSLFWDPNIYGRYLALTALFVLAAVTFADRPGLRPTVALAVIAAGLVLAFSQSSFISLIVGACVLVALRWSVRLGAAALAAALTAIVVGIAVFAAPDDPDGKRDDVESISSGRTTLVSGGLRLAGDRPLAGHGSASFSDAFRKAESERRSRLDPPQPPLARGKTTLSHNEPITVLAEQGAVGFAAYLALIAAALTTVFSGLRGRVPGLRNGGPAGPAPHEVATRAGLAAAFVALLVHTVGYAGYLTDPLTWALLAVAGSLAAASPSPAPDGDDPAGS